MKRAFLAILVEGGVIYLVYFLFSIAMILSQGAGTAPLGFWSLNWTLILYIGNVVAVV